MRYKEKKAGKRVSDRVRRGEKRIRDWFPPFTIHTIRICRRLLHARFTCISPLCFLPFSCPHQPADEFASCLPNWTLALGAQAAKCADSRACTTRGANARSLGESRVINGGVSARPPARAARSALHRALVYGGIFFLCRSFFLLHARFVSTCRDLLPWGTPRTRLTYAVCAFWAGEPTGKEPGGSVPRWGASGYFVSILRGTMEWTEKRVTQ